jgi:hypothetical protein
MLALGIVNLTTWNLSWFATAGVVVEPDKAPSNPVSAQEAEVCAVTVAVTDVSFTEYPYLPSP